MPEQRAEVPAQSIFTLPENMNPITPPADQGPASVSGDKDFLEKMMAAGEQQIAAAAARAADKGEPDLSPEEWVLLEQLVETNFASKEVALFNGMCKVKFKTLINKEHTELAAFIRDKATKDNLSEMEIISLMSKGTLALSLMYINTPKSNTPFIEFPLEKKLSTLESYTAYMTDILITEYNKFNGHISRLMGAANFLKK